jgi:hypothetical protein
LYFRRMSEVGRPYDYEVDGLEGPIPVPEDNEAPSWSVPEKSGLRRAANVRSIGGVVLAGLIVGTTLHPFLPRPERNEPPRFIEKPKSCPAPAPKDMEAVEQLFASASVRGYPKPAERYGVTIHDGAKAALVLSKKKINTEAGFFNILEKANSYTSPYGVRISIIGSKEAKSEKASQPSPLALVNEQTKHNMEDIVEGILDLPVEYVHFSGVKRVVLYDGGDKSNVQASIGNDGGVKTIYYNLYSEGYPGVMAHEIYHGVDWVECGGDNSTSNDPGFTKLNPANIYQKGHSGYHALDNVHTLEHHNSIVSNINRSMQGGNKKGYCHFSALENKDDSKVATLTDYSFKNQVEDKAELGAVFGEPKNFSTYLYPTQPIVKKKLEFVLARLYHFKPNIVKYFAAVSSRPYRNRPPYKC